MPTPTEVLERLADPPGPAIRRRTAEHLRRALGASVAELAIYGEMITMFNELTDLRTSRLTSARSRIPIAMKILLYTGAVITVASMYFMAFGAVWLHATVTGALAGSIANILFLIQDLDDAFAGDWRVASRPFERALRMFAKRRSPAA